MKLKIFRMESWLLG